MKIGQFVRLCVPAVFEYCETRDTEEFLRLQDPRFSKETFGLYYPFCRSSAKIARGDLCRYWKDAYLVHGLRVKVTSQWFDRSLPLFQRYLGRRGIPIPHGTRPTADPTKADANSTTPRTSRGRYRDAAIGNAQNLLVRNLLSRLGDENFGEKEWQKVIAEFSVSCAYCGAEGELLMDQVVPINKEALGEHRLGNLVPSCRACNIRKGDADYRDFLSLAPERLAVIDAHMERYGYVPLGQNRQLRQIIEHAHQDVRHLAERYAAIINAVMVQDGK